MRAPVLHDNTTEAGAERLKATILRYWSSRGPIPKVWVEEVKHKESYRHHPAIHVVRSDMVCGQPQYRDGVPA